MSFIAKGPLAAVIIFGVAGISAYAQPAGNAAVPPAGQTAASKVDRETAYRKLAEGERLMFSASRQRSQAEMTAMNAQAKQAFLKAIEADPALAEAYTALAELTLTTSGNVAEAIAYAEKGVAASSNNFGSRRILARLYTFRSGLNSPNPNAQEMAKAVQNWEALTKLDPRNAEAWAFLAAFYEKLGKRTEQIAALKSWMSSAPPSDRQFYRRMMGGSEDPTPESATLKLAEAYLQNGNLKDGIELINNALADEPDNPIAIALLREAATSSDPGTAASAAQALRQAVYVNPNNIGLILLLADLEDRSGNRDAAIDVLSKAAERMKDSQASESAVLFISIGDKYFAADRFDDAVTAYETALLRRGIDPTGRSLVRNTDPEFTAEVLTKILNVQKTANRPNDVQRTLDRARKLLGADSSFADNQQIAFYRETGRRTEAVAFIKGLRLKRPGDSGLARLQATLMTENGQVDEAVADFIKFTGSPAAGSDEPEGVVTFPPTAGRRDVFSDDLFISQLYTQAGRSKEAIEWANKAVVAARGAERRQLGRLTLASAQQTGKDFAGAEATLRDILKESPNNPIALNNLGYFLLERNERFDEALKMIEAAVKADPTNSSYLDSLGWAYFKLNKLAEAEKYLLEAARFDPSSATIQEHLGDVAAKKGESEKAKAFWQKALRLAGEGQEITRLKEKLGVK